MAKSLFTPAERAFIKANFNPIVDTYRSIAAIYRCNPETIARIIREETGKRGGEVREKSFFSTRGMV